MNWRDRALCAEVDPELWFPEKGGSSADAKRTCLTCPVRVTCLEYAQATGQEHGIWGGVNMGRRSQWRTRQGMAS